MNRSAAFQLTMKSTPYLIGFVFLLPAIAHAQSQDAKLPSVVLRSVPDLTQTTKEADFAGGGSQFCAPVAVSNSLVWLEGRQKERRYQIEMVKTLAGEGFMSTSLVDGTGTTQVIKGVQKYANQKWPNYHRLEYSGWRKCPNDSKVAEKPTLQWMIDGLHDRSAVWVNVGWYVSQETSNGTEFKRVGGHWVTLVGHSNGKLILHDPAPRAGKKPSKQKVKYRILGDGRQTGNKKGLPLSAAGSIALSKGMKISKRANTAIIDGVVIFEIEEPAKTRTWNSSDGKFSIEAQFIELKNGIVVLQTTNKRIEVPLEKLSAKDQKFVQKHTGLAR